MFLVLLLKNGRAYPGKLWYTPLSCRCQTRGPSPQLSSQYCSTPHPWPAARNASTSTTSKSKTLTFWRKWCPRLTFFLKALNSPFSSAAPRWTCVLPSHFLSSHPHLPKFRFCIIQKPPALSGVQSTHSLTPHRADISYWKQVGLNFPENPVGGWTGEDGGGVHNPQWIFTTIF